MKTGGGKAGSEAKKGGTEGMNEQWEGLKHMAEKPEVIAGLRKTLLDPMGEDNFDISPESKKIEKNFREMQLTAQISPN